MERKPNPSRQAYLKRWRKEHPEAVSRYNRQYWERRLKREQQQGEAETQKSEAETRKE